jgi:hypothetical protein
MKIATSQASRCTSYKLGMKNAKFGNNKPTPHVKCSPWKRTSTVASLAYYTIYSLTWFRTFIAQCTSETEYTILLEVFPRDKSEEIKLLTQRSHFLMSFEATWPQ